jgi:hypothetical protein
MARTSEEQVRELMRLSDAALLAAYDETDRRSVAAWKAWHEEVRESDERPRTDPVAFDSRLKAIRDEMADRWIQRQGDSHG